VHHGWLTRLLRCCGCNAHDALRVDDQLLEPPRAQTVAELNLLRAHRIAHKGVRLRAEHDLARRRTLPEIGRDVDGGAGHAGPSASSKFEDLPFLLTGAP
jgi:hypothetical protein